ncbi:hypothetical protein N9733_02615 [Akkermansiaceae bacterium]|nr:hypothetical protein [Akkermansiaceae bacterium]
MRSHLENHHQKAVEDDLTQKVENILAKRSLSHEKITFTGRQLTNTDLDPAIAGELDGIIAAYIPPQNPSPARTHLEDPDREDSR